jgi:cell division septation protein DedD
MASYHREVYQPSFEDGPTYALQDDEVEEARARLPLLIVIALLVLASFAGVVWLAYNQGLERGMGGTPTVISAPDLPIRTLPPEDGAEVGLTGLKIYNDPVPADEEAETSTLAQLPPTDAPMPDPLPAPAVQETAVQQTAAVAPVPPPPVETAPAAVQPAPVAPAPQVAAPPPAAPPAPTVASAVSGGALLQVGAYPSEELAQEAWQNFRAQFPGVATGLSSDIQRADLGERGIWYRVRVGPFADESSAVTACDRLKADGGNCFVAAP